MANPGRGTNYVTANLASKSTVVEYSDTDIQYKVQDATRGISSDGKWVYLVLNQYQSTPVYGDVANPTKITGYTTITKFSLERTYKRDPLTGEVYGWDSTLYSLDGGVPQIQNPANPTDPTDTIDDPAANGQRENGTFRKVATEHYDSRIPTQIDPGDGTLIDAFKTERWVYAYDAAGTVIRALNNISLDAAAEGNYRGTVVHENWRYDAEMCQEFSHSNDWVLHESIFQASEEKDAWQYNENPWFAATVTNKSTKDDPATKGNLKHSKLVFSMHLPRQVTFYDGKKLTDHLEVAERYPNEYAYIGDYKGDDYAFYVERVYKRPLGHHRQHCCGRVRGEPRGQPHCRHHCQPDGRRGRYEDRAPHPQAIDGPGLDGEDCLRPEFAAAARLGLQLTSQRWARATLPIPTMQSPTPMIPPTWCPIPPPR